MALSDQELSKLSAPEIAKLISQNNQKIAEIQQRQIAMQDEARPTEITPLIERLELIEEKLGVRFDGIYGVCSKRTWENPEDFLIEVNFDVVGTEETLKRSFQPTLSAYNSVGQLLNTATSFIHNERFLGIESTKISFFCSESPVRLRLYPANPM